VEGVVVGGRGGRGGMGVVPSSSAECAPSTTPLHGPIGAAARCAAQTCDIGRAYIGRADIGRYWQILADIQHIQYTYIHIYI
jgi:hypothetical protein